MRGSRSRRAADQRGISMLVVVILVLVTVVLCFAAILLYANMQEKEKVVKALEDREKRLNTEQARIRKAKDLSLAPTGFTLGTVQATEGGEAVPASDLPIRDAHDYLKKIREKYLEKGSGSDAQLQDLDKKFSDLAKNATGADAYNTLQELVVLAAQRVQLAMNAADQKKLDLELAEERKITRNENKGSLATRGTEYEGELQEKITTITNQKNTLQAHVEGKLKGAGGQKGIEDQITEAAAKIDALRIDYAKMEMDYANRMNKLRSELEELKVKEVIRLEISEAHGRILNPDIPNKVAFIDIGSRERVVPGLKFLVAKRGAQGRFEYKGKVVVKKVWMTYAEVSITDIDNRDVPIIDGDLIVNPLFNKKRPVVVHFVGEREPKRLRPNWTVNEATRRLMEIGSESRDRLTLDVDFVIYTESRANTTRDQDEGYKLAVLLGIPIEEASELYRFLED
jgi:hypothetical protein